MKLVIQVKSKDNLEALKGWVQESFKIIENKELNMGQVNVSLRYEVKQATGSGD